ncbi:carbon-nitrogen hydrolase family protein [Vibrio sp. SCSIO 43136]|uniref:carbon-nitrogen hydrolase family protein n=1 Tax=Vibrio sp. SCSIO 43136 TaxID=2819101 RepID=UPI0020761196|nr:carbon-nitrogen hydrolase family protein [Vibrio sp. SCSIO 43136]USD65005.1 carbon-nitrogen hydrolase family protein [Vibrio sp. SCSIO 43136]
MPRIGLIQMTSSADADENLAFIAEQAQQLAAKGCDLICTPENAVLYADRVKYWHHAEPINQGKVQSYFSELAKTLGCYLHLGSFPIQQPQGVSTSSLVWNDKGDLVADYAKLHLFDVDVSDNQGRYRESDSFVAGNDTSLLDTPFATLGLSICYDLRFPELYQNLARQGANLIIIPAAFTKVTGQAHWQVLLQARAIETQSWVVAIGQTGIHSCGRETWGHSMVISPWGEVTLDLGGELNSDWVDIDLSQVSKVRQKMPLQNHARFGSALK